MKRTPVRLFVAAVIALNVSCARSTPPPNYPVAGQTAPDAGLSPPPPPAKKGVIVPSDMGPGPGTPGRGAPSQSPSPGMGSPGMN